LCLHEARLQDPAPLLVGQRPEQLVETGVLQRAISVSRLPAGSRTCALTTHPLSVGGISTLPPLAVAAATAWSRSSTATPIVTAGASASVNAPLGPPSGVRSNV